MKNKYAAKTRYHDKVDHFPLLLPPKVSFLSHVTTCRAFIHLELHFISQSALTNNIFFLSQSQ